MIDLGQYDALITTPTKTENLWGIYTDNGTLIEQVIGQHLAMRKLFNSYSLDHYIKPIK
jgi:hypothetical protein